MNAATIKIPASEVTGQLSVRLELDMRPLRFRIWLAKPFITIAALILGTNVTIEVHSADPRDMQPEQIRFPKMEDAKLGDAPGLYRRSDGRIFKLSYRDGWAYWDEYRI